MKGVSEARIFGQKPYAVHVQVNPGALAARGIGLEEVRIALTAATVNRPKGNLTGAHQTVTLDTNDQLFNAAGFRNVIVAWRNGAPVRLGDIAEVDDGVQNVRTGAWFEGKPAEGLAIQREAGANTIQVVDTVKARLPKLQESIPPSVHVDLVSDRSLVIRAAVHDVQFTMMLTIGLVVLVIFIFLRTLWATVIPSLAVPLSLLATFGVMYGVGYSLDNISLMALTISVGFVVDDAIVMIENIVRYLEQGDRPVRGGAEGRRPDRLHDHLDHLLADRGVHPAAVHGRHHRPAVPRIRGHRVGRGDRLGLHLADPDAGHVLAVSEGPQRASAGPAQPGAERVFEATLSGYDRGPQIRLPPPVRRRCWRRWC